jgi:hypothetical protein
MLEEVFAQLTEEGFLERAAHPGVGARFLLRMVQSRDRNRLW